MNRVFYLFRHGETDWNKERRCQGHTDIPLNENGKIQASLLAQKLSKIPLEIIVTSDLQRAHATGTYVARHKNIPLQVDPRLREMSYGAIEGLIYEEAIAIHGEEMWERLKCFKLENDEVCFPGGETRKETRARFLALLDELAKSSTYEHIGISTHGGVLRTIVHTFLPEDHPMIEIPNCVVYKITYNSQEDRYSADSLPLFKDLN